MLYLYSTSDRSFWELARLTLHGEGIETFESDTDPAVVAGAFFMQRDYRIYLVNDEDFTRANELLLEIGAARSEPVRMPNGKVVALLCFLAGLAIAAFAIFFK